MAEKPASPVYFASCDDEVEATKTSDVGLPCRNLLMADLTETFEVYLRVRPPTADEAKNKEPLLAYTVADKRLKVLPEKQSSICHEFTFSKILDCATSQSEVFDATTITAVQEFVTGQNSIVFSYGVTNSGKTYTMQGMPTEPGVIPRAVDLVFQSLVGKMATKARQFKPHSGGIMSLSQREINEEVRIKKDVLRMNTGPSEDCSILMESLNASNWRNLTTSSAISLSDASRASVASLRSSLDIVEGAQRYSLWISYVEIYNEKVYDLLRPITHTLMRTDLKLQENREGQLFVKGVREICVDTVDEALHLLVLGQQNLQVASTKLNYTSSRSHSLYTIKLIRVNVENPNDAHVSQLCFCDLAGSERYSKTKNVGKRLKEAGVINSSLLVFSRCVTTLRHNQTHRNEPPLPVPFRESKLTRVFQGFFTGRGKASMIVSVSPIANSANETIHVLRFSALAKEIILPHNLDFLTNPTKVTRLSLDWIRQSLDQAQSISWDTPRPSGSTSSSSSMRAGAARYGSYSQRFSNVLVEEDENIQEIEDADNEIETSDDDEDNKNLKKLQQYFDTNQILIELLLKEHSEKCQIELKIREKVGKEFMAQMEAERKRNSDRVKEEIDFIEKMYGKMMNDRAAYYLKQIQYKEEIINSLPTVKEFEDLKETARKQTVEHSEKIKILEEELSNLRSKLAANAVQETLYETVLTHGSSSSDGGNAVEEANRRWSLLYKTNDNSACPIDVEIKSQLIGSDQDVADVFHDIVTPARPRARTQELRRSLVVSESSDADDEAEEINATHSETPEECVVESSVGQETVDELLKLEETSVSKVDVGTLTIVEAHPSEVAKCFVTQQTELTGAHIDGFNLLEEKVTELEATVELLQKESSQSDKQLASMRKNREELEEEIKRLQLMQEVRKPLRKTSVKEPSESDSDFENVQVTSKRLEKYRSKRTAQAAKYKSESSDGSFTLPSSKKPLSLKSTGSRSKHEGKPLRSKRTKQPLAKTDEVLECSPCSSPEAQPAGQRFHRVLRPRK